MWNGLPHGLRSVKLCNFFFGLSPVDSAKFMPTFDGGDLLWSGGFLILCEIESGCSAFLHSSLSIGLQMLGIVARGNPPCCGKISRRITEMRVGEVKGSD